MKLGEALAAFTVGDQRGCARKLAEIIIIVGEALIFFFLGLAARYGWVDLPAQFQSFNHPVVIGAAIVMYLIEFFAVKIPYVDTVWDVIHTAIRPIGGALIAVATLGDASAPVEGLIALLGGTVAASSHLTKTSTRAVANTSPEPVSNWGASFTEDVLVMSGIWLALAHPLVFLLLLLLFLLLLAWLIPKVWRGLKIVFGRLRGDPAPGAT